MASLKLRDVEAPKAHHLRDMIVDSLLILDIGDDETFSVDVIHKLCEAHSEALWEEEQETGVQQVFLIGAEAEKRFNKATLAAYRNEFPDAADDCENLPTWPDALPFDQELSTHLIDYAGYLLGHRTAKSTKEWYAYCQKHGGELIS
jgi:hypothetical protein